MASLFVNHVHVFPAEVRPEGTPEAFVEIAAELGIAGAVLFAPFTYQWPGNDPNAWLARKLRRMRGYVGYGTLDPQRPARDQVSAISELGLVGIKIHPAAQHFPINCDWAMDAYAQMERLGLVADMHLGVHGYRLRDYHPLLLDEVAHRFPNLRLVMEHVGGWHFFREATAVLANHREGGEGNFYAGIASVLDRERHAIWYLGPEGVRDLAWQLGAKAMIYGTDFPYNGKEHIAADLALIRSLGLPAEVEEGLLGRNVRTLLGLRERPAPRRTAPEGAKGEK
jgi:hypothetical protein